ncbi:sulfurtransferase TusA family protein [Magnetovibrio sp. PR-2]|uniref:sulfurtransferase TusA family protein n=1 Tax=Magnetovibrio sp. PR-2 TaxID=3120356 RepID=UPI002FCE168F
MNAETLQTATDVSTLIDVKGAMLPVPIFELNKALNRASDNDVFAVQVSDKDAEPNFRDFCQGTGNVFIGVERYADHDVYYVQKRTVECSRCSNIRAVTMGIAVVGVLTYTAPQVLLHNPSGLVLFMFAGALAAIAPVSINLFKVAKRALKRSNVTIRFEAAE